MRNYPNCTWRQFEVCNDDCTTAFEDMVTRLFYREILKETEVPHANAQNPGVEIDPVFEPSKEGCTIRRRVSFQAKYFSTDRIAWGKIKESIMQAVKHYEGQLDHIYLFCNKTITRKSKPFQEIEHILAEANITIQPITNKDILNILSLHKDIADYFFLQRRVAYDMLELDEEDDLYINSSSEKKDSYGDDTSYNVPLTKELLAEKVEKCRALLKELRMSDFSTELNKVLAYDTTGFEEGATLSYFAFLRDIHFNNESKVSVPERYRDEATLLQKYFNNPYPLSPAEFVQHGQDEQLILLEKMFTSQFWNAIVDLDESNLIDDSIVQKQVHFHAGLSFFNMRAYERAGKILNKMANEEKAEKYSLFAALADIQHINEQIEKGCLLNLDCLTGLIEKVQALRRCDQYKQNERLIAYVLLVSFYHLGTNDAKYFDKAASFYDSLPESLQNEDTIKYHIALCYELKGEPNKSTARYEELDWLNDEIIAQRYFMSLVQEGRYVEVVERYRQLSATSPRVQGPYLLALHRLDDEQYKFQLAECIERNKASIESLFSLIIHVDDKDIFKEIIVPVLSESFLTDDLANTSNRVKEGLVFLLAQHNEVVLMDLALSSIGDCYDIDQYVCHEIYKSCFEALYPKYVQSSHRNRVAPDEKLAAANRITDRMLNLQIMPERFLQLKVLYCGAMNLQLSMLKYAKDLFELTHDPQMARNIVAILCEQNEEDPNNYEPYLSSLKEFEIPDYCITIAHALHKQGKYEEADLYAYKALYVLNGTEDYEAFRGYLGYYYNNMARLEAEPDIGTVQGNTVLTLSNVNDQNDSILVCLDSENEFNNPDNTSLGIIHIPRGENAFFQMLGHKIDDEVRYRGKSFRIVGLQSRKTFAAQFIFSKVNMNPEKFNVWTIKVDSAHSFSEQVRDIELLADQQGAFQSLLSQYYREESAIGIPIDILTHWNYSKYPDAIRFLLFAKDQALYAGYPEELTFDGKKVVPTLSTLILVAQMGWMNIFEKYKKLIIIHESYGQFFRLQYSNNAETGLISPGTLFFQDEKMYFAERDRSVGELWNILSEFCFRVQTCTISDDERISEIFAEDYTLERLFAGLNMNLIQTDALVLAKRENAVYMCEDFFFRQLAETMGIQNCNFASLLYHISAEERSSIMIPLSKTNYIHMPFLPANNEEALQLYRNLLEGKRKNEHYSAFFIDLVNSVR